MADGPIDILVTGGAGQVGLELARVAWPDAVRLHLPTRETFDLADPASIRAAFAATPFAAVISSGAYTAVDKAEDDVAASFGANAMGPAVLAEETRKRGVPLIHVSTDYVFDGRSDRLYVEDDPVAPLGVYGASKLAGELAVLSGNPRSVVLRTAWVLSVHRANFLKTMLRVGATRPELGVVDDQIGCPTSARDIAETLAAITLKMLSDPEAPTGVYHFVNAGETSWCGLAREIFTIAAASGGPSPTVKAITTADYPTPAKRPANSRLSTAKLTRDYGITPRPWREAVTDIIDELSIKESAA